MSDNDGTIEPVEGGDDTNLDDFAASFFGNAPVDEPTVDEPEDVESEDEVDESDEDNVEADADDEADEDDDEADEGEEEDEESEPEPEEKPHKNRKTAKERISELARERREERLAKEQAVNELNALKARLEQLEKNPAPQVETAPEGLYPDPDATDSKGELVYPLGKLDPAYNAEVTRRTIRAEMAENAKKLETEAAQREQFASQQALVADWNTKLTEAEKVIPDLRPKIADLEDTFANIDPDTGVFLAETIMTMPRGVEVLNYLADNIGEAEELVALNPRQAVITLGRIEGRLPSASKEGSKPKVSKAPKPPVTNTRGVGVAKRTPGDTDNLEAFEREFFRRK